MDGPPAVIICNTFEEKGPGGFFDEFPIVLLPFQRSIDEGKKAEGHTRTTNSFYLVIDHHINWLFMNGIKRILLFCTKFGEVLEKYLSGRAFAEDDSVHVVESDIYVHKSPMKHCSSIADILREIYMTPSLTAWLFTGKAKSPASLDRQKRAKEDSQSNDFLLITGNSIIFNYRSLHQEIKAHNKERRKNSRLLFSLLGTRRSANTSFKNAHQDGTGSYAVAESICQNFPDCTLEKEKLVIQSNDNEYLLGSVSAEKLVGKACNDSSKRAHSRSKPFDFQSVEFSTGLWEQIESRNRVLSEANSFASVIVQSNITEIGIAICSPDLLAVMKENFDFESLSDCVNAYTIINDDTIGNAESEYANEELNRAINHYDIRMPVVSVSRGIESSPVSIIARIDHVSSYRHLLYVTNCTKHRVNYPFKQLNMPIEALQELLQTIFKDKQTLNEGDFTYKADAVVSQAAIFQTLEGLLSKETILSTHSNLDFHVEKTIEQVDSFLPGLHLTTGSAFSEIVSSESLKYFASLSREEEHNRLTRKSELANAAVEDYRLHTTGEHTSVKHSTKPELNIPGDEPKECPNVLASDGPFDESARFYHEMCDLLATAISSHYRRTSDIIESSSLHSSNSTGENQKTTVIDSESTLISTLMIEDNDLRVSLSQLRFMYNQKPKSFGSAFLLAIFRLVMKEAQLNGFVVAESSDASTGNSAKQGKLFQKIFQNYAQQFAPFLKEDRFGGNGHTHEDSQHGKSLEENLRLLFFLIETSRYVTVSHRMPYLLRFFYELDVISDEEIFGLDDLIRGIRPDLEEIRRAVNGFKFISTDSITSVIFDVWDFGKPFIEALYDAEE